MSYHMKSARLAEGDWFQIEIFQSEKKVYIHRVIFWVFVEAEHVIEHLDAICDQGTPRIAMGNNHLAFTDCIFVNGRDKCHSGETWLEVYDKTLPCRNNTRDITDLFSETK
jgi:hypothetical protein